MRSRSSSTSSSTSSVVETPIQIFVKSVSGENIPFSLPPSTTISTLKTLLSLRTNVPPSSLRLVHAGRHLTTTTSTSTTSSTDADADSNLTLESAQIPQNSTIHLTLPLRGGMPPKKIRCNFKECRDAAQRIVGDCTFCSGHFCGKHRMLEDHKCSGLEDCRKESHERNAIKLNSERTTVIKGM